MRRTSGRSTERSARAPLAIAFAEIPTHLLAHVARVVGAPNDSAAIQKAIADAERVKKSLACCDGLQLAILELLVDFGGRLEHGALIDELYRGLGVKPDVAERALKELARLGLTLGIMSSGRWGDHSTQLLYAGSADQVAEHVQGLTLPQLPHVPENLEPAPGDTMARDRSIVLAAVAHFAVRATSGGTANRTTLKKLVRQLEGDADAIGEMIDRGLDFEILRRHGEVVVPVLPRLRELARGEHIWSLFDSDCVPSLRQWLSDGKWVECSTLIRALTFAIRTRDASSASSYIDDTDPAEQRYAIELVVTRSELLERAEHEGLSFVRWRDRANFASGDGFVTPNLEVMLGPNADPELAALIALAAEPGRLDHVVTFRITHASISTALGLGVSLPEIEDALARVGRHAVPDNVLATIRDFARSAKVATLRSAWVVETANPETADAIIREAKNALIARPTPTLVLLDRSLTHPETALARAGVRVGTSQTGSGPQRSDKTQIGTVKPHADAANSGAAKKRTGASGDDEALPPIFTARPDSGARSRFHRDRELGFVVSVSPPSPPAKSGNSSRGKGPSQNLETQGGASPRKTDARAIGSTEVIPSGAPTLVPTFLAPSPTPMATLHALLRSRAARHFEVKRFLIFISALYERHYSELAAWMERLDPEEATHAREYLSVAPLELVPWLIKNRATRSALLAESDTIVHLIGAASTESKGGDPSQEKSLAKLYSRKEVQRFLDWLEEDEWDEEWERESGDGGVRMDPREAPRRDLMPELDESEIEASFNKAMEAASPVWLLISSRTGGDRVVSLLPERILRRGKEVVYLGTDPGTQENRSFPASSVISLLPFAPA